MLVGILHGSTLIPTWKYNHMISEVGNEIADPFQSSTVAPFKFGYEQVISSHTFDIYVITYPWYDLG